MGTVNLNYSVTGVGSDVSTIVAKSGGRVQVIDHVVTVADNVELNWTLDIDRVYLVFMMSTVAVTLGTNASPGHTDSISLAANTPLIFMADGAGNPEGGWTCPFTVDVTKLFVHSAYEGLLYIRSVEDQTP